MRNSPILIATLFKKTKISFDMTCVYDPENTTMSELITPNILPLTSQDTIHINFKKSINQTVDLSLETLKTILLKKVPKNVWLKATHQVVSQIVNTVLGERFCYPEPCNRFLKSPYFESRVMSSEDTNKLNLDNDNYMIGGKQWGNLIVIAYEKRAIDSIRTYFHEIGHVIYKANPCFPGKEVNGLGDEVMAYYFQALFWSILERSAAIHNIKLEHWSFRTKSRFHNKATKVVEKFFPMHQKYHEGDRSKRAMDSKFITDIENLEAIFR